MEKDFDFVDEIIASHNYQARAAVFSKMPGFLFGN
jgi:hypothetical protein